MADHDARSSRLGRGAPLARPRSSRLLDTDMLVLLGINVAIVTGMWVRHDGWHELSGSGAGFLVGLARLTGLYASLLALIGIVLASRPAAVERRVGLDRALAWHRRIGGSFTIVAIVHSVVSVLGYAAVDHVSTGNELGSLFTYYRFMVPAAVGTGMLTVIALSSLRAMRRRLAYETWYFLHLLTYAAIALAFGHQVVAGTDLVTDNPARYYWIGLHLVVLGVVVWSRVGGLVRSLLFQRLRVDGIVPESSDTYAIYLSGTNLRSMRAEAGQFYLLRVLKPGLWWQTHPYSLSSAPTERELRFTVKQLGDASGEMLALPVGTPVALEGPYGQFTASAVPIDRKVLLIGAGIGIAPLRAILETLRPEQQPVVLYRVRAADDLVHLDELDVLAKARNGRESTLVGPRVQLAVKDPFAATELRAAVPDVESREVFVCGPESMLHAARKGLMSGGVPLDRIHCERFWY